METTLEINPSAIEKIRAKSSRKVLIGWIEPTDHPGYSVKSLITKTVAEIAKRNNKRRPFLNLWLEKILSSQEIKEAFAIGNIDEATRLIEYNLILSINDGSWQPNSPQWIAFKAKHGLDLNPLKASLFMLSSIGRVYL